MSFGGPSAHVSEDERPAEWTRTSAPPPPGNCCTERSCGPDGVFPSSGLAATFSPSGEKDSPIASAPRHTPCTPHGPHIPPPPRTVSCSTFSCSPLSASGRGGPAVRGTPGYPLTPLQGRNSATERGAPRPCRISGSRQTLVLDAAEWILSRVWTDKPIGLSPRGGDVPMSKRCETSKMRDESSRLAGRGSGGAVVRE